MDEWEVENEPRDNEEEGVEKLESRVVNNGRNNKEQGDQEDNDRDEDRHL